MKKRIAIWIHGGVGTGHFSQGYPPLEKLLIELSRYFELVIYSQSQVSPDFQPTNFSIRSASSTLKGGTLRWLSLITNFIRDHRVKKFDAIFAFWGYPAGFLATCVSKISGIPCAVYVLGSDAAGIPSIDFGIFHKPLPRKLAMWTYNNATLLLSISDFQKKQLEEFGLTRTIISIPWGAETALYKFSSKKRGDVLRIIHVGHLTPVKDQATMLRAVAIIAKHHPVDLRIFGVDCMNGAIQKICRELKIETSVQFLDMVPYHDMPEQYAWADIMLHTSLSEGQSMALTEAAACGVLLAGTKVGLLYDLGERCGIVVETGDFEELSSKVLAIIRDDERWNNKVQQAKSWSEAHDLSWTVNKLVSLLNDLSTPSKKT
jgi:glycosyltransferase involved in cell wall biosynthesis